ncbi:MAG: flippase [Lachnospiraceae bacterium]|nr:flippase [Lachnospiraceae bacterium]
MQQEKLIKNYIYNTLYQILVLIAPLITTPYISRVLGATGIGIYSYAQSIATYFVLVGAVGTTLYGQREIAYTQNDPIRRTEVFWEITIFRFIAVTICTIIYYFIFAVHGEYSAVYKILTLEVFATAFDISWFFMGMENFRLTVLRNTLIKLCGIILIFLFVKTPEDVQLYTWCLTLPVFIGNVSLWFGLKKYLIKLEHLIFSGIPAHIKPILILFFPQIAIEIYTVLDKTMIGIFGSDIDQVGYYTQAQKVVKITLMIVTSLGTVMLPAMSAAFAQGKKEEIVKNIKESFRFVFMLAFALIFGLIGISETFVPIFFGKGYDLVVPLMVVMSPILLIIGISNIIGKQFLLPTKQQSAFTISIVIGACVNFGFNALLIPFFDAIGASIATLLAELSVTFVQILYVRKQLPLRECFRTLPRYLFLGVIMFLAVRAVGSILSDGVISLCILVFIGMSVYALELIITKDELLQLGLEMIKKKKV